MLKFVVWQGEILYELADLYNSVISFCA